MAHQHAESDLGQGRFCRGHRFEQDENGIGAGKEGTVRGILTGSATLKSHILRMKMGDSRV